MSIDSKGIPPVIHEIRDEKNLRDGKRLLCFQELSGIIGAVELHFVKIRGRRTLPPPKFFEENDVVAIETAPSWQKPVSGGYFLRRVLLRPKESPLVNGFSIHPEHDDSVSYLFNPPKTHTEARKLLAALEAV